MAAPEEELSELSDQTKQLQEKVDAARNQSKADLEKTVSDSPATAEARAAELRNTAMAAKGRLSTWWDDQQKAWNDHLAKLREDLDEKKGEHDTNKAGKRPRQMPTSQSSSLLRPLTKRSRPSSAPRWPARTPTNWRPRAQRRRTQCTRHVAIIMQADRTRGRASARQTTHGNLPSRPQSYVLRAFASAHWPARAPQWLMASASRAKKRGLVGVAPSEDRR
jgi:hypothetical protein